MVGCGALLYQHLVCWDLTSIATNMVFHEHTKYIEAKGQTRAGHTFLQEKLLLQSLLPINLVLWLGGGLCWSLSSLTWIRLYHIN